MYEMMQRHRATTVDTELEQDSLAELNKLQRQIRIMENDKKAYISDTFSLIDKQNKLIKALEEEKRNIDASLDITRSNQYLSRDVDNLLRLRDLLKQKEEYIELIKAERSSIKILEKQKVALQRQIDNEWKKIGGKQAVQEHNIYLAQKCHKTENILEHGVKEYNKYIAENQRLRTDIENLLIIRKQFNSLHAKLSNYLTLTKKDMTLSIADTTQAFGQREECQSKLQTLKDKWDKDDVQYQQELRDLQRTIADDQNLKEFMEHKTQDRHIVLGKKTDMKGNKISVEENNVEFYRKAFDKILSMTGEESIEALVERILRTEDDNFALFNYVNELNREIEQHLANVHSLRTEINDLRVNGQEREKKRQDEIRMMQNELENLTMSIDEAELHLNSSRKEYDGLIDGIQSIFNETKGRELVEEGIMEEGLVNERTTMAFLSAIEQKAAQLVVLNNYMTAKAGSARKLQVRPTRTSSSVLVQMEYSITTPNIAPEPEMVDEDLVLVKPLERNEIRDIIETERKMKFAPKPITKTKESKSKEAKKKITSRTKVN